MIRYVLVCLALASFALGQAANSNATPPPQKPAASTTPALSSRPAAPQENQQPDASKVAPDAPVITINGLCDNPPADKSAASDCKTVITREQFEKAVDSIQPNMPARGRQQFAQTYARFLVMSAKAHEMGLDQGPKFEERMKLMRIQVLSQALNQAIQEKAAQVSDQDIEDYYKANGANFEEADLQRVFIPKNPQAASAKSKTGATAKDGAAASETPAKPVSMKAEADKLHTRAVAGESLSKLQAEAFQVAGMKTSPPSTAMGKMRRSSLPPSQASVMELKAGSISSVISDDSGYYIYKLIAKETLPLDKVREEIRGSLRSQHMQEQMQAVQQSGTSTFDEAYFGPPVPGPGMMRPGMPPTPPQAPAKPAPKDKDND